MVKIEAVIRPSKLMELKDQLVEFGVHGMTVFEVGGFGRQRGQDEIFRGTQYLVELVPKLMVAIITTDEMEQKVIDKIREVCFTGEVGDGKIFVYPVKSIIRIRTGEMDEDAL